jgi:uncharacterized protein (DUF58 family)
MPPTLGIGALGLTLVLAGGLFDAEGLYVPGVALLALAIGLPAWVRLAVRAAVVMRSLERTRVEEDEALGVVLEARAGRVPPPGAVIVDPLLGTPARASLLGGSARIDVTASFPRRGRHRLPGPQLVLSDPLDLSRRVVKAGREDEVLVLPRTGPVEAADGERSDGAGLRAPLVAALGAAEVDGLRPYREGAPAARIHWPAVARGAGLVERRLRPDADSRTLVVLDSSSPDSAERLDAAVRAAASLTLVLARAGGCALLLPGERRALAIGADLVAWPAAHARLALIEEHPSRAVLPSGDRRGAVFLVVARADFKPSRAVGAVAGPLFLVTPGALPGRAAAFRVAGCHGYELGRARRGSRPQRLPSTGGVR